MSDVFDRYLKALTSVLCDLGLPAEKSGRNDILVNGRKVSGNALHQLPDKSIVHGTLLYSTDLESLTEAIRPPVEKLQRHGVESVRQRVVNLEEYKYVHPVLESVESLEDHIVNTFADDTVTLTQGQVAEIERMTEPYIIR